MDIHLAWHSNSDQDIQRATLRDEPEGVRKLSFGLDRGTMQMESWLLQSGGQMVQSGGCDGQAKLPAEHLDELLDVLRQYQEATGSSCSCGIGSEPHEAMVALKVARKRGGNPSVVLYTPEVAQELDQVDDKTDAIFPEEADQLDGEGSQKTSLVTMTKADRFQLLDLDDYAAPGAETPDQVLAREHGGSQTAQPPQRPLAASTPAGQVPTQPSVPQQLPAHERAAAERERLRNAAAQKEKDAEQRRRNAEWQLASSCPSCGGRGSYGGSDAVRDPLVDCSDPKYHPAKHASKVAWEQKLAAGYQPENPVVVGDGYIYDGEPGFAEAKQQAAKIGKSEALAKAAFGNQPSPGQASKIAAGQLSPTAAQPSPPSPQSPPPAPASPQQAGSPGGAPQQGGPGELLQAVGQVLMDVKQQLPSLEKMKKENPQAYQSIVAMTQAVIALAQKLGGGQPAPGAAPMQKTEKSFDTESEEIKERRKTSEAQQSHPFQAAYWTHKNGHPRCRLCGDEERTGGRCEGAAHDGLEKGEPGPLTAPKPLHPTPTGRHELHLPVGTQRGAKVRVVHADGSTSWLQCKAGQITSGDGHAISSRNPGGR